MTLLKKGATLEAQEKIMELREAVLKLQEENQSLKGEITTLKEELSIKKDLIFDGTVYWMGSDRKDGPFCQPCYDTKKTLVRLHESDYEHRWRCHSCKTSFKRS